MRGRRKGVRIRKWEEVDKKGIKPREGKYKQQREIVRGREEAERRDERSEDKKRGRGGGENRGGMVRGKKVEEEGG